QYLQQRELRPAVDDVEQRVADDYVSGCCRHDQPPAGQWFHAVAGWWNVRVAATNGRAHGWSGNKPSDPVCTAIELLKPSSTDYADVLNSLRNLSINLISGNYICHYKKSHPSNNTAV